MICDVIALSDESHVIILIPWVILGCLIGSFVLLLQFGGGDLMRSRCVCVRDISLCLYWLCLPYSSLFDLGIFSFIKPMITYMSISISACLFVV